MPAYFDIGFSVREPAWHGLAAVLDQYPGREEAMRLAGHNFKVLERRIQVVGGTGEIANWKALVRDDSGAVLSVVKDSYEVIQNSVLWDILDAIVQQPNVKYETAGTLREGCTLWALARLDEPWKVPGDDSYIMPFVSVGTAHDGSHQTEAMAQSTRIVCWNTYVMARNEARRRGLYYAFRHTKNVQERLDQAHEALLAVRKQFEVFKELALELAAHPVTDQGVQEFLVEFIPEPKLAKASPRAANFIEQARAKFAEIMGSRTIPEAHRRTAWGLYCAGTEFLDHARAFRSNETYFHRVTSPNQMKKEVAKLALKVAS